MMSEVKKGALRIWVAAQVAVDHSQLSKLCSMRDATCRSPKHYAAANSIYVDGETRHCAAFIGEF